MSLPLVSILMAVHNGEEFLQVCLDSISQQSYTNWELIVVDDGSDDATSKILEKYARNATINDVKVLNLSRRGTGACINEGLKWVNGKYIARMDADDLMLPHRIESQVNYLMQNPDTTVVGSHAWMIDETGEIVGIREKKAGHEDIIASIAKYEFALIHPTLMIDTNLLNRIKYREVLMASVDLALLIDLAAHGKFSNLQQPLIKKRIHESSISNEVDTLRIFQKKTLQFIYTDMVKRGKLINALKVKIRQIWIQIMPEYLLVKIKSDALRHSYTIINQN